MKADKTAEYIGGLKKMGRLGKQMRGTDKTAEDLRMLGW